MDSTLKRKPLILALIFLLVFIAFIIMWNSRTTPGGYYDQGLQRIEIPLVSSEGTFFLHRTFTESDKLLSGSKQPQERRVQRQSVGAREYFLEIPVRENTWFKTWYKYAPHLGSSFRTDVLLTDATSGEVLSVTIEVIDKFGNVISQKNITYSNERGNLIGDDQESQNNQDMVIKRRAYFAKELPMTVKISINTIRPETFTNDAYFMISTWSDRRCRHIECMLD